MSETKKTVQSNGDSQNDELISWGNFAKWVNGDEISKPTASPEGSEQENKKPEGTEKKKFKVSLTSFQGFYKPMAVLLTAAFIGFLLFVCVFTPKFGVANAPTNNEVSQKYIEDGLKDTGATNIVSSMILDYRAFDTLGESTVLFTAVMAVMILLRKDEGEKKDKADIAEEKAVETEERIENKYPNIILRTVSKMVAPFIIMYGAYVILNGHISPGGGFSGGAIIGAGLILISLGAGPKATRKFFSFKIFTAITSCSLLSYAGLKTYSFYTGAHHIETGVPLGTPGAILSSGFILPLNIFVGMIVACTMFGFYSLFTKGEI
ncbi:MAG: hypothetical protein KHZ87_07295 [Clostridiales bacterium]|nr:hypothetical protein [Clostridiales bacterium]MBS5877298.1 hypothetical protein [Clostridiales bacterium]MDU0939140.1 hydrogen gas-evolving membrane-bound hydrogenase subunit E [Clostridiales bacterium]MDU1042215.1 hydrogen gas-evolving membrane-bound hydrogenase subunit E [Clostridiales bacterium]